MPGDDARATSAAPEPDLGVLTGILFRALQDELWHTMAHEGFDDLTPRHGALLAHLRPDGVRPSELSQLAGLHKQIIGNTVDELEALGYVERRPDPADRRAKLVVPTERGTAEIAAARRVLAAIGHRHADAIGAEEYTRFMRSLTRIAHLQQRAVQQP